MPSIETEAKSAEDEAILKQLQILGEGGIWLWIIFILCASTGIFNGTHVSSYVFLGAMPEAHWCQIPELSLNGWSDEQIRNVSIPGGLGNTLSCSMYDRNYSIFVDMSPSEIKKYLKHHRNDPTTSCSNGMKYLQESGVSIVTEWDLVCDKLALRSTVQVALSIGKFLGAFIFGIISDKFGRKFCILVSSIVYIISAPLAATARNYLVFLFLRLLIGAAGSGVYHTTYTLLTEIAGPRHRSWMSIVFNLSYPIGMLILAATAYHVPQWRDLQLAISIPSVMLLLHCWYLPESPRWLVNKGRRSEAYKIVFGSKFSSDKSSSQDDIVQDKYTQRDADTVNDIDCKVETVDPPKASEEKGNVLLRKMKKSIEEMTVLFGHKEMRRRLFICHFTWMSTSLSYYAMALNVDNFAADRYVYVALTGALEIPSYFIPLPMLKCLGRRMISFILFMIAGLSLLSILAIPQDNSTLLMVIGLCGRLCISGVFAVVILHTSELFPTLNRNSAIGSSSTMAHVGSIAAPYIVDLLGALSWFIPTTICGAFALASGCLIMLLPETKNKELCDTPEEIDMAGQGKVSLKNICN